MKNSLIQGIPTLEDAESILKEAEKFNPGPWVEHSKCVAEGAKLIAANCEELDSEAAYILGLLHDIGKKTGKTTISHAIDGYNYCKEHGYSYLAKICVTHSCPTKSIGDIVEVKEVPTGEGYNWIEDFLNTIEYDDYDKLIQLCDAIALPNGFTLIEKRLVDVALRHDVNEYTVPKWKAFFESKQHFEKKMGQKLYNVLPGVIENTFEL